jgi:hypothetical protein
MEEFGFSGFETSDSSASQLIRQINCISQDVPLEFNEI